MRTIVKNAWFVGLVEQATHKGMKNPDHRLGHRAQNRTFFKPIFGGHEVDSQQFYPRIEKILFLYGKPVPGCLIIKLFMKMTNLLGQILLVGVILSSQAAFAQTITGQTAGLENTPNGKIVKAWYTAWQTRDWNLMTQILADGFTFSSPLDDHIKINAVKERCWPNAGKIKSADVQQLIISGDVVFVISNGYNTDGKLFRNCDYFTIKDGKISAYECFFGPGINYPTSGK